jgi:hypothetical protein
MSRPAATAEWSTRDADRWRRGPTARIHRDERRLIVFWWPTSAGDQPVVMARRVLVN